MQTSDNSFHEDCSAVGSIPSRVDSDQYLGDTESRKSASSTAPDLCRIDNDAVTHTRVRDVLNYFGKCPDCGYTARASAIARTLRSGVVHTTVQVDCALPCGWQANAQSHTSAIELHPGPLVAGCGAPALSSPEAKDARRNTARARHSGKR